MISSKSEATKSNSRCYCFLKKPNMEKNKTKWLYFKWSFIKILSKTILWSTNVRLYFNFFTWQCSLKKAKILINFRKLKSANVWSLDRPQTMTGSRSFVPQSFLYLWSTQIVNVIFWILNINSKILKSKEK